MKEFDDLIKIINESKTIALVSHIMPDGDAIGSLGAMYHYLKEIGKEVYMVIPNLSKRYFFLPDINEHVETVPLDKYDLLISLDLSDLKRMNISKEDIEKADKIAIIDHHKGNNINTVVKVVDEFAPANCQIVYDFIKHTNHKFSKNIAEYIYLGLMTDTGSFAYERTSSKTYMIAAEMLDLGVNFTKTCKLMNDTHTENKMKLVAYVINNMEVYFDGKVRLAIVDKDIIDKLNATQDDVDSLVDYLRCIEGTKAAIYIRYIKDSEYKVSMRTEDPIDAAEVAFKFNGGGHIRAAGFTTYDLEKDKKELIEILERLF